MKKKLLWAERVCKRFPGDGDKELILNHVDVEIYEGDFTIIMGPSGAGKSTLLYALSGMEPITDGKVFYRGREVSGLRERQMAGLRSREFGFVFQQTHLVSNLSLFENVAVAGYLNRDSNAKQVEEKAGRLLLQMHVEKAGERLPAQTSGGEAQRAAVARAMINGPGILFADEPTGALNKRSTDEVLNLFTGLNRAGQSILMVTHDLRAAIRGTRILYLEDGAVLDELALPPFDAAEEREREAKANEWLASLAW